MARQRTAPGEWGKITNTKRGSAFVAKVRIRDSDGVRRLVEASGRSPEAARRNLNAKLQNRLAPTRASGLTSSSTVSALASSWFAEQEPALAAQSYSRYRDVWNKLCAPAIGELLVREVRTGTIDSFLRELAARAPSSARIARVVCTGVFSKAVRLDLMPQNPVREVALPKNARQPVRSVTLDELNEIRSRVAAYCVHEEVLADGTVKRKPGPKPGQDLQDIMDLLIATGARIGEVLALRYPDLRLDVSPPTATIQATLIVPRVAGERLWRQEHRKGGSPPLTLVLPEFAATILRRRAESPVFFNPHEAVFVTSTGNWLSPSNVRRSWRAALGADFSWVRPHSFRKTVATLIKETYGIETAQTQLGHSSTRVTEAHYIQRINSAPNLTATLDLYGPSNYSNESSNL